MSNAFARTEDNMSIDCGIMAHEASRKALSQPTMTDQKDGTVYYWADMTLGDRTVLARVDAQLVDIQRPDRREDFLTNEFLAVADGLIQEAA